MEKDSLDSKNKSFLFKGDQNSVEFPVIISRKDEYYKMDHKNRGTALIFNHRDFKPSLGMAQRNGTDADCANLRKLFTTMGFKVKVYENMQWKNMKLKLKKVAEEDHTDNDCFACVVLSHGEEGIMYAEDTKYSTAELWTPFLGHSCPTLVGKPKLFFIQACQGNYLDDGVEVYATDSAPRLRWPSYADFLIAYSTVPGYYSWRNTTNGSWFIQALHSALLANYENEDLLSVMIKVNSIVAFDFESSCQDPKMHEKKQVPYITFTLTKKVLFGKK